MLLKVLTWSSRRIVNAIKLICEIGLRKCYFQSSKGAERKRFSKMLVTLQTDHNFWSTVGSNHKTLRSYRHSLSEVI